MLAQVQFAGFYSLEYIIIIDMNDQIHFFRQECKFTSFADIDHISVSCAVMKKESIPAIDIQDVLKIDYRA